MPVLTKRPMRITLGDTVSFKDPCPQFGAEDYSLKFIIQCLPTPVVVDAASDHTVTISPADTDGKTVGVSGCFYQFISTGGEKYSVPLGNILLVQDPTEAPVKSPTEIALDQAIAARSSLMGKSVKTATVNGEIYTLADIGQLNEAINSLRAEVNAEYVRAGRKPLIGGAKKIQTYF